MTYNLNTPLFADRYRFEPVENDWDRGRNGKTVIVYDLQEKRLGVIKRTEIFPKPQTHSLQNEIKALKALKGLGVPEVYDVNQAVYDSKNFDYAVIEYIDGIRVEKNFDSLSIVERAEIITQLFELLSQAHQKGIVNGDVDLKHLFWRKDKKQLVVIDWGNARLDLDPKKNTEFAYDLARAAEVIFSLVTRQGHPQPTGSIALPDASALVAGLGVLPVEFSNLCKWAPRKPSDGARAPYTAKELFEVSKKWLKAIRNSKPYKQNSQALKKPWRLIISLLGIISFALLAIFIIKPVWFPITSITPTFKTITQTSSQLPNINISTITATASSTITPTGAMISTAIPTDAPLILTATPTPLPTPLKYSSILAFENEPLVPEFKLCWTNEVDPKSDLVNPEGFNRKIDNTWWIFNTGNGRTTEESIRTDFGTCPNDEYVNVPELSESVNAIALNAWVTQIQPERGSTLGGEFGLFLKATNGFIREYTLWVDKDENLHLRIREDAEVVYDDTVLVVNIQHAGRDNIYNQFRIQIFLEMDNHGSAIIYLLEADSNSAKVQGINPNQMIRIDAAVRPKIGVLQGFGLIGRGGSTQVLIWPLALLGK